MASFYTNAPATSGLRRKTNDHSPERYSRGLNTVIIGAGIGALTAAIYLRYQGHAVTVLELTHSTNDTAAVVQLTPNSNGLLRRIGIFAEHLDANSVESVSVDKEEMRMETADIGMETTTQIYEYDANNRLLRNTDLTDSSTLWLHPWHLVNRARLHEELSCRATSLEGEGVPVIIRRCSCVSDIDATSGTALLDNGERVQGEVLIGADGINVSLISYPSFYFP
jgi:2-polyprenyl-6-methoxyphenol hydroxylase-like FAD-dependent oxidoreductase